MLLRRYTFKLYPSRAQTEALERQRLMHCALYNALLQQRIEAYQRQRKTLTYFDQCKEITALRADDADYRALSRSSMDATAQRLDRAFQAFFRRAKSSAGAQSGFPRFRASKRYPSIPFKAEKSGWSFDLRGALTGGHRLRIQGVPGLVRARGKLPAPVLERRSCEILCRDDSWWLSLVVAMEPRRRIGVGKGEVEFDLIDSFAVVRAENGERLAGLEDLIEGQRANHPLDGGGCADPAGVSLGNGGDDGRASGGSDREDDLRRALSACRKGSYRWRARRRLLSAHTGRKARRRQDRLHVWSTRIQRSFGELRVTAPESIKGATATGRGSERDWGAAVAVNATLNRRVLDFAAASAIRMLEYKIAEAGGSVRVERLRTHPVLVGNELRATAKAGRKARRKLQRESA